MRSPRRDRSRTCASLSGYVKTRDGEMLVFSIIANDFVIPAATVNWIADLGVEHLANWKR